MPPDHVSRSRLSAWAAGVLAPEDEDALRRHLDTCAECRAASTAVHGESGPMSDDSHLPSSLLARWPVESRALDGLMRELAVGHLRRCASCRAELVALGHPLDVPILTVAPAGQTRRPARTPAPAFARRGWLLAASAAAGIAIVAWVVTRDRMADVPSHPSSAEIAGNGRQPGPGSATGSAGGGAPEAARPSQTSRPVDRGPSLQLAARPVDAMALPEQYRGAETKAVPTVSFRPGTETLAIELPASLAVLDDGPLEIALLDSAGVAIARLDTSIAAMYPGSQRRALVLHRGNPPLSPGRYALRYRRAGGNDASSEESRTSFELR